MSKSTSIPLTHVLSYWIGCRALGSTDSEGVPIEKLGAMIELGSKYEIEDLKERGLKIIHNDNPTKLQDWDNMTLEIHYDKCGIVVQKILEIAYDYSLELAKPMAFFSVLLEMPLACKLFAVQALTNSLR